MIRNLVQIRVFCLRLAKARNSLVGPCALVAGLTLATGLHGFAAQNVPDAPGVQQAPKTTLHRKSSAAHAALPAPVQEEAPAPVVPEPPKWPLNDPPAPAAVRWDSQGLQIQATNSSLRQILDEVATTTGAKVEGLQGDERVFGDYGPGPARDVISQILPRIQLQRSHAWRRGPGHPQRDHPE